MLARLYNDDWEQVFAYAHQPSDVRKHQLTTLSYTRESVKEILAMSDGEGDEDQWIGLFEMLDGRFLVVRAGCDSTGWDCQQWGSAEVADDLGTLILYGLSLNERERLGIKQL